MRKLASAELNKRGCELCTDYRKPIWFPDDKRYRKACIHDAGCPYHELDNVERCSDYDRQVQKQGDRKIDSWLKKVFIMSEKYSDCQKST